MDEKKNNQSLEFSSWTCLVANKKLLTSESNQLRNHFSDAGQPIMEQLLANLSKELSYANINPDGTFGTTPFDEGMSNLHLGGFSPYPYSAEARNEFRKYYLRLRIGELKDNQDNGCNIFTTWIRAFLCTEGKIKVTASSYGEIVCDDLDNILLSTKNIFNKERGISEKTFKKLYIEEGKLSPEISKFIKIIIYRDPDFEKIGILPIQNEEELAGADDKNMRSKFNKRILNILQTRTPKKYPLYISLLEGKKYNGESSRSVNYYPIPINSSCSLMAEHDDMTYGISGLDPWDFTLKDIVNTCLALE